jgi:hypothetical protein
MAIRRFLGRCRIRIFRQSCCRRIWGSSTASFESLPPPLTLPARRWRRRRPSPAGGARGG